MPMNDNRKSHCLPAYLVFHKSGASRKVSSIVLELLSEVVEGAGMVRRGGVFIPFQRRPGTPAERECESPDL